MLTELCQELKNWFDRERYTGTFQIEGGSIAAPFLADGQYYRVMGSVFNDGVHQYGHEAEDELKDESWSGAVWALAIPKPVINLSTEIEAWQTKYGTTDSAAMSPFTSESFGGYSYSKGSGSSASNGGGGTDWRSVFASRMNMWRKM